MPKGVVREAAGHAVGLNMQIKYLFGINAGDVIFTASDIGRIILHTINEVLLNLPRLGCRPLLHSLCSASRSCHHCSL